MNFSSVPNRYDSSIVFDFFALPHNSSINEVGKDKIVPATFEINTLPIRNKEKLNYLENRVATENLIPEQTNLINPIFASSLSPTSLNIRRTEIKELNLLPTTISMSQAQQAFLSKMVNELADQIHKLKPSDTLFVWKDECQTYEVRLRHHSAKTITGLDELNFRVTTQEHGYYMMSEMRMRRFAFSSYAQFVDYWDPNVAMHNDKFTGRVHTNYNFTISRGGGVGPKFNGKVTTATYEIRSADHIPFIDENSMFVGGIARGVKEIRLPKDLFPSNNRARIDTSRVHQLSEDTWITFYNDGSYFWKNKTFSALKRIPSQEEFFILGDKKVTLHVKGVVNGKVLIYSEGKIIINDDLLYARHPEKEKYADDYLGLVSQKDVEIAPPSVTGPGDLYIFAAIYARGRFHVSHLYGNGEAKLHIYGSLSAGSLSATEPRYATRIVFDNRLEKKRPPHFPLTEHYELVTWDRQWKVCEK